MALAGITQESRLFHCYCYDLSLHSKQENTCIGQKLDDSCTLCTLFDL